jgi:hypothetical protein
MAIFVREEVCIGKDGQGIDALEVLQPDMSLLLRHGIVSGSAGPTIKNLKNFAA